MALTILDYDKKVQNIPTRNISGQNNLGKLTKKTTKHMEFSICWLTPPPGRTKLSPPKVLCPAL